MVVVVFFSRAVAHILNACMNCNKLYCGGGSGGCM